MGDFKDKHGKTRVGKILQDIGDAGKPILQILSKAPIPGADLLGEVANAIKTSEDIDQIKKQELLHALTMDMQDLANARGSNVKIQETQFASWMAKNVPYLIDMFIMLIWGGLTLYFAARFLNIIGENNVDLSPLLGIYAGVTGLATQVLNFHRGSSMGSRLKDVFKKE